MIRAAISCPMSSTTLSGWTRSLCCSAICLGILSVALLTDVLRYRLIQIGHLLDPRVCAGHLTRISHGPVRNAHGVPTFIGVSRESFRPGKLLPKQLATGDLLTNRKIRRSG